MRAGAIVGIQDIGAAAYFGFVRDGRARRHRHRNRSRSRAAARNWYDGIRDDAFRVAERMLIVAERGRERQVHEIFRALGSLCSNDRRGRAIRSCA